MEKRRSGLRQQLSRYDFRLFRDINNLSNWWRWVFLAITQLGGPFAVVVFVVVGWLGGNPNWALRVMAYGLVTLIVTMSLKLAVSRPRPDGLLKLVHKRTDTIFNRLGFPSGHTAMATVLALLTWSLLPAQWRFLAPVWIGLVGFSRVYLGAHMPLDVAGGFVVGVMVYGGGFVIEKLVLRA